MTTYITNGQPWDQQYDFNTSQVTNITGWAGDTNLPVGISQASAIVTRNRVYIFTGVSSYTAAISGSGVIGAWAASDALPYNMANDACAWITKNRVYLAGGTNAGSEYINKVYSAPIDDAGMIGTWSESASLIDGRYAAKSIITKDRVYLIGGIGGGGVGYRNTTLTAPIDDDGIVGAWEYGPSLPITLAWTSLADVNGRIYVLGGVSAGVKVSNTYSATYGETGVLSAWSAGSSLSVIISKSSPVVTRSRIYLLGGDVSGGTVLTAPINSDGTIGTWAFGTTLYRAAMRSMAAVTTNSRVYLLGGGNPSTTAYVQYAPFSGGYNDYSEIGYVSIFWTNFSGQTEILT